MNYLDAGGWNIKDAVMWTRNNKHKNIPLSTKPTKTTKEFYQIQVTDGSHLRHKIQTIRISGDLGIKAVVCADCEVVISYLFMRKKVFSVGYLHEMLSLKLKKLAVATSPDIIENYKHTIKCLKRELRKRKEK